MGTGGIVSRQRPQGKAGTRPRNGRHNDALGGSNSAEGLLHPPLFSEDLDREPQRRQRHGRKPPAHSTGPDDPLEQLAREADHQAAGARAGWRPCG